LQEFRPHVFGFNDLVVVSLNWAAMGKINESSEVPGMGMQFYFSPKSIVIRRLGSTL
jgi:hypothetical protein